MIMSLDPNLPVGACKESGIGREGGRAMIDASTQA
jgi:acyl-CoA reductase-like NAD-dependent aldehyde dehydrogenase